MKPTRPNTLHSYAERLSRESVAMSPRPTSFSYHDFWREFDAPGGMGERIAPRHRVRIYRVAEICEMDVGTSLPQMIDHHAGMAWKYAQEWAGGNSRSFCPDFVPGKDGWREVCDMLVRFPELLRDRLDAVLEGLRKYADPNGYYEQGFMEWQRTWYGAMQTAYAMSNSEPEGEVYETRLRLCRQAAKECFPDLIEWFDELREHACDGGYSEHWRSGESFVNRI